MMCKGVVMKSKECIIFVVLLLSLVPSVLLGKSSLPIRADRFVNDYAEILSIEDKTELRTMLSTLRQGAGVEAVVVTVDSYDNFDTGDLKIEAFATRLFNTWGIGDARRNNGVLILLAVVDRSVRIELGAGYGRGRDAAMSKIIDNVMIPAFKRGSYSDGLLAGARAVSADLSAPPRSVRGEQSPSLPYSDEGRQTHRMKPTPIFGLLGFGVMLLLGGPIAIRNYRRSRTRTCEKCNIQMERLDEIAEDDYLDNGQQTEESVGSVDYDVWRCPDCEHHAVYAYRRWLSKYKVCPDCDRRTVEETKRIIRQPTYSRSGKAEVAWQCLNCRYVKRRRKTLPRLRRTQFSNSSSSSFYRGSSGGGGFSSGSSGGGGFSSGSSGGGWSSGGGASGDW